MRDINMGIDIRQAKKYNWKKIIKELFQQKINADIKKNIMSMTKLRWLRSQMF